MVLSEGKICYLDGCDHFHIDSVLSCRNQKTFSVKDHLVNVLGFLSLCDLHCIFFFVHS